MARTRAPGRGPGISLPGRGAVHPRLGHLGQAPGRFRQAAAYRLHWLGHAAGGKRAGIRRRPLAHDPPDHALVLRISPDQEPVAASAATAQVAARPVRLAAGGFLPRQGRCRSLCRAFPRIPGARRLPADGADGERHPGPAPAARGHHRQGAQARHDGAVWPMKTLVLFPCPISTPVLANLSSS